VTLFRKSLEVNPLGNLNDRWWKWQTGEIPYPIYRLHHGILNVWRDGQWHSSTYLDRVTQDPEFIEVSEDEAHHLIGQRTLETRLGVDSQRWPRNCLIPYPAEFEDQIDYVQRAVQTASKDPGAARELIRQVDSESMKRWYVDVALQSGVWRSLHLGVSTSEKPGLRKRKPIKQSRLVAMFQRDNWRCQYCGIRIGGNRKHFVEFAMDIDMPELIQGRTDETRHGLYSLLMASYDHITPHSRGGSDDDSTLVTACWCCQFGKYKFSLDEVGLQAPSPAGIERIGDWQGLCS
jgi:hypothetical protein